MSRTGNSTPFTHYILVIFAGSTLYAPNMVYAQDRSPRELIKAQAGCFEVTFQYHETKAIQAGYKLKKPKKSRVIEYISVEEDTEDKIVLQHILVSGLAMIKHWRQVWIFEETDLYRYKGNDIWERKQLDLEEVSGEWSQVVYNVDDGPRYECSAQWNNIEGFWSCTADAPLPRREKSRKDYNVLERTNIHRITLQGWVHEQYNTKVKIEDSNRIPIVKEKGYNTYIRIPDTRCKKALSWWPKRRATWSVIQKAWADTRQENTRLQFRKRFGAPLWVRLFMLARDKVDTPQRESNVYSKARKLIEKFLVQ